MQELITTIPNTMRANGLKEKRCKWCYNIIHFNPRQHGSSKDKDYIKSDKSPTNQVYCCIDCKQESEDWASIVKYRKDLDRLKEIYRINKNNPIFKQKAKEKDRKKYINNKLKKLK